MSVSSYRPAWLEGYASKDIYNWEERDSDGVKTFCRRLGVVESLFDNDGTNFEGRADLNVDLHVEFRTSLSLAALNEHIALAWSVFRQQHVLLSAKSVTREHTNVSGATGNERSFEFQHLQSTEQMLLVGRKHVTFLGDHYRDVDRRDFYQHLMNASRPIDGSSALSRLFVHPYKPSPTTPFSINFVIILAHQITDGLTVFRWVSSFIDTLNLSNHDLHQLASPLYTTSPTPRLPPPQEALYPPMGGTPARQRWFWAIARILRHVKRPPPASFPNPLRRLTQPLSSTAFPPKYSAILDYTRTPPLNNHAISPVLSRTSTARLTRLCREAHISIGSGLFTLVALVMMSFHERLHPSIPLAHRLPFVGSFPVNPRPFLSGPSTTGKEDSLMLAFSEGIVLPFLPADLGTFAARFRVLGRQAHRQLKQYQKRPRTVEEELKMGAKAQKWMLPMLYLSTMERLDAHRPVHERRNWDVQGAYPASAPKTLATCGVSSVGDRTALVSAGRYDTSQPPTEGEGREVVADFRMVNSAVRARDGEFLCGAASDREKTYFMISVDSCAIDVERAEEFKGVIEGVFEDGGEGAVGEEVEKGTGVERTSKL